MKFTKILVGVVLLALLVGCSNRRVVFVHSSVGGGMWAERGGKYCGWGSTPHEAYLQCLTPKERLKEQRGDNR
jgi:hypothetical protein